jgi:two-component system nitrogen regulation response regulator NtrX
MKMMLDVKFRVEEACSAEEALNLLEERGPEFFSVLVTDLWMPGMSGLELIDQIRMNGISLPSIICSGTGTLTLRENAVSRGVYATIIKGEKSMSELWELVNSAAGSRERIPV